MLELQALNYAPATASGPLLQDVALKADIGRPVLVAGASGSGKTSLLEVIAGLSGQQRGSIRWKGQELSQRQRRWLSGMVFQFPERHFLGLTIAQELRLGHRRLTAIGCRQHRHRRAGGPRTSDAPNDSVAASNDAWLAVQLLRGELLLLDEPTADWTGRSTPTCSIC